MGRAIAAVIERELIGAFAEMSDDEVPVFAADADEALATRVTSIADRESGLRGEAQRLRERGERFASETTCCGVATVG